MLPRRRSLLLSYAEIPTLTIDSHLGQVRGLIQAPNEDRGRAEARGRPLEVLKILIERRHRKPRIQRLFDAVRGIVRNCKICYKMRFRLGPPTRPLTH